MLKVLQSFGNNAALVFDDHQVEWVVLGKGVGFGCKKGDVVDEAAIQNRYKAIADEALATLTQTDTQVLNLTNDILEFIAANLTQEVSINDYASLADHLAFMLQRTEAKIQMPTEAVRWEIQKLFPKEYELALQVVPKIEQAFEIELPENEAVFLTYHFIDAENQSTIDETLYLIKLIKKLMNIVQFQYRIVLDQDSFSYNRFVSHLRLFLIRYMKGTDTEINQLDPAFVKLTQDKYSQAFQVASSMVQYLTAETGWQIGDSEKVFLTLHLMRFMQKQ